MVCGFATTPSFDWFFNANNFQSVHYMAVCEINNSHKSRLRDRLLCINFESFRENYSWPALEEFVNIDEDRKSKLIGLQELYQISTVLERVTPKSYCSRNSFVKYFSNYFKKPISKSDFLKRNFIVHRSHISIKSRIERVAAKETPQM